MHAIFSILLLSALLFLSACGGRSVRTRVLAAGSGGDTVTSVPVPLPVADVPVPADIDSNFNDFVYLFATSRSFRGERTASPLPVETPAGSRALSSSAPPSFPTDIVSSTFLSCFSSSGEVKRTLSAPLTKVDISWIDARHDSVVTHHFARVESRWTLSGITLSRLTLLPESSFLYFFHLFATDSTFRFRHITSTLSFSMPDPTGSSSGIDGYISRAQWDTFSPVLPDSTFYYIDYGQQLLPDGERVLAFQTIATGDIILLYFTKTVHSWMLYRFEG